MSKVLDSEARLDLGTLFRAMWAGQLAGVMRYIAPASWAWPKVITRAEYDGYLQWRVPVGLNFESTGRSWRGGHAAGLLDGAWARQGARDIGAPDDRPILFSADEEVTDLGAVGAYLAGINEANGGRLQGFYGDAQAIDYLFASGLICIGWQTNARSWAGDQIDDPRAAIIQRTSHSLGQFPSNLYDESDVQLADWGQIPAPGVPTPSPAPAPAPAPKPTPPAPPDKPQTGGFLVTMPNVKVALIKTEPRGFNLFSGVYDAEAPVGECSATIHGPDPHSADASSPDDWWGSSIDATPRAQARGNHVVVTVFAPNWKQGDPYPAVHVQAFLR